MCVASWSNNCLSPPMDKHKKRRETTDEFCKRLGIKRIKGEKGGVEFSPYHGGNLSPRLSRREDDEDERDQQDVTPGGAARAS